MSGAIKDVVNPSICLGIDSRFGEVGGRGSGYGKIVPGWECISWREWREPAFESEISIARWKKEGGRGTLGVPMTESPIEVQVKPAS